jgi:multicomponent Na+:H+ antiporter subunit B
MPELYLRLLDRILTPILMLLAAFLFFRGHNEPGGGFIAGLVAAAAIQLQILSRGDAYVRARIGRYVQPLTGIGLVMAAIAALLGFRGGGFFKSIWTSVAIGETTLDFGTPVLFDLGVLLVVVSVVTSYLLALSRSSDKVDV